MRLRLCHFHTKPDRGSLIPTTFTGVGESATYCKQRTTGLREGKETYKGLILTPERAKSRL